MEVKLMDAKNAFDNLKAHLIGLGWKEQRDGTNYLNGEYMTNFLKDGEIIGISYNAYPDEETINDLWPEHKGE
jgi:hypothetical protein